MRGEELVGDKSKTLPSHNFELEIKKINFPEYYLEHSGKLPKSRFLQQLSVRFQCSSRN